MHIRTLDALCVDVADSRDVLERGAPSALQHLQHADPRRRACGHVGIGSERHRAAERHEDVAAVRRDRQQVGRRIDRQLVDQLDAVDDLIGTRVHDPEEVAATIGNPQESILPGERGAMRVGVLLIALVEDDGRCRRIRRAGSRRQLRQGEDVEVGLIQVRRRPTAGVDVHLSERFGAKASISVDEGLIVLGNDLHRRDLAVDDEQAAATERHEGELAGGIGDRANRRVVGAKLGRLALQAARRDAVGQVDHRRRVELKFILVVVGADALEELAVLIRDGDVGAIRRRRGHMGLSNTGDAGSRPNALDRLTRLGVDEEHVPGRDERHDDVRLQGVDRNHVRPDREGAGP